MEHGHYGRLLAMAALHFVAMYVLMYAMVSAAGYALPNGNQLYMAALMTGPMLLLELAFMRSMFPDRRKNALVLMVGLVLLVGSFVSIREQVAIGDRAFLRSMIPHHSGAILMCEEARLEDPEVRALCKEIIESQQREIDWMQARLESMRERPG
jgi:uncharacterized protein (DUF305 family)